MFNILITVYSHSGYNISPSPIIKRKRWYAVSYMHFFYYNFLLYNYSFYPGYIIRLQSFR